MEKQTVIKIHPSSINALVELSLEFAKRVLWNKYLLEDEEVAFMKEMIADYYSAIPAETFSDLSEEYFNSFCLEILKSRERDEYHTQSILLYLLPFVSPLRRFRTLHFMTEHQFPKSKHKTFRDFFQEQLEKRIKEKDVAQKA